MLIEFGEGDLFREIFVTTAAFDLEVPLSMLRKGDSSNILSSSHEDKLEEDHVDILPIIYYKRRTSENQKRIQFSLPIQFIFCEFLILFSRMSSNYWLVQIKYNNFNTSMIMKIAFNKEIHLYKGEKTMKSLKNYCEKVFKHLPFAYDFYYIDQDHDQITLSTNYDIIALENNPQLTKNVKKIYIRKCQDPLISDRSDDDFCELQVQKIQEIKTINLIEESLMIKDIVKNAIAEMNEEIIKKWQKDEEKLIQEEVDEYVLNLSNNVTESILNQNSIQIQTEKETSIEEIVDEKIKKMLPSLIKKVTKIVETKLMINGCSRCQNRSFKKTEEKYHDY